MGTNAGASRSPAPGSSNPDPVSGAWFLVEVGAPIGYFTDVSGLTVEYEVKEYSEGGVNDFVHKLRGRAKYQNLVLTRGVTHEKGLVEWFQACRDKTERRDLTLTMLSPAGDPVRTWSFAGAFPVKWTGPDMKAGSSDFATETLEIAHQGFSEQ